MSDAQDNTEHLGQTLVRLGWSQGAIFRAEKVLLAWNDLAEVDGKPNSIRLATAPLRADDWLVVVSQTCDIVMKPEIEPYVEAVVCRVEQDRTRFPTYKPSARRFVVDEERGLVAHAELRVQLSKQLLATLTPEPWPGDERILRWFQDWLAWRYLRPAIDDDIVQAIQPAIREALSRIKRRRTAHSAINRVLMQLLLVPPSRSEKPYDITLVLLLTDEVDERGLSAEQADALNELISEIERRVDPANVTIQFEKHSPRMISLSAYMKTWPLYGDYLTFGGEDSDAALPPHAR